MSDEQAIYEIRVRGHLDERWSDWFNGMVITLERDREGTSVTTLRGRVDQAKLRGILNKIWDLGLMVMAVFRVSFKQDTERRGEQDGQAAQIGMA